MACMTQPSPAAFPVTTAFELPGMIIERDLGVAFGLVVRSMGFDSSEIGQQQLTEIAAESADQAGAALAGLPPLVPRGPAAQARRRGHGHAASPGPGWIPTAERFRDPTTGTVTRVWLDPGDQSRHYVPEPDG
jgi:hypothetical protein